MERISVASATPTTLPDAKAGGLPFMALHTKTVITHVERGFDFLGQNVRRYPNGKLLIKPSKKNVGTFLNGIRRIIKDAHGASAADLIDQLNLRFAVGRTIIGTW